MEMISNLFKSIQKLSQRGNYLCIMTDGEGEISVEIYDQRPELTPYVTDFAGNQVEPLMHLTDVSTIPEYIVECETKIKADKIRSKIGSLTDSEVLELLGKVEIPETDS